MNFLNTVTFSFLFFLSLILLVGLYAKKFSKKTSEDYLLANGNVPVWQVTISALASNYSGFMYIGLIGYTYTQGISGIWLMVFWMVGEFFVVRYAPKYINQASKKHKLISYNDLISNYWGNAQQGSKKIAAIITLVFLSVYAAAQFDAAGKALHAILDFPIEVGIAISYVVVLAYCFAGGIRASIWTDVVQFLLMIISIGVLVFLTLNTLGGWQVFVDKLHNLPDNYNHFFPDSMGSWLFIILFFLGWVFAGLGSVGQPHIAIRFMALRESQKYSQILHLYYSLAIIFTTLCLLSALLAKVYFTEVGLSDFDPESALPKLALSILPAVLVGLLLAGIFAAIVSTADSQVLSCAASLGNDLLPSKTNPTDKLRQNKFATILTATFALVVALYGGKSVFVLVIVAWSGLASAFAPVLILYFIGYKISQTLNITIIFSGLSAAIIWRILGLNTITYDALIGILTGLGVFLIAKQSTHVKRMD